MLPRTTCQWHRCRNIITLRTQHLKQQSRLRTLKTHDYSASGVYIGTKKSNQVPELSICIILEHIESKGNYLLGKNVRHYTGVV